MAKGSMQPARETYHHGNLREALLTATQELVARGGVAGFSMNAAARAVGVSTAAPYRHFANKEALLAEAVDRSFAALRQHLHDAASDRSEDPLIRLTALGTAYVDFALTQPASFHLLFGTYRRELAQGAGRDPSTPAAAAYGVLTQCVQDAFTAGRLRAGLQVDDVARAAWSIVHGLAVLHLDGALQRAGGSSGPQAATTAAAVAVFVGGLEAPD